MKINKTGLTQGSPIQVATKECLKGGKINVISREYKINKISSAQINFLYIPDDNFSNIIKNIDI